MNVGSIVIFCITFVFYMDRRMGLDTENWDSARMGMVVDKSR